MIDLPRFGLRLFLPKAMDQARYYGYGPYESYVDKQRASYMSRFETTAKENHEDYIRPQENGSHYGCLEAEVTNSHGTGVRALSEQGFSFNILAIHRKSWSLKSITLNWKNRHAAWFVWIMPWAAWDPIAVVRD